MEPVVHTTSGAVQGFEEESAAVFLGVPYAAAPFGAHRFGPPAPPPRWEGTRPATAYGPTAPQPNRQFTLIPEPVVPGDDCLNLNVFTPAVGDGELRPVLVWIHGGGFTAGCNRSPWYRGTRFARDGVVVVSINYRLGAEGFLVLDGAPSNRGVLDWVAALEWVAANIAAFGGDPGRVTIAGQSAGGVACATLLAVPRARGLFRQAILMSGAGQFTRSYERAAELGRTFATELGVAPSRDGFAVLDPDRIVEGQEEISNRPSDSGERGMSFGPVIDGEVVAVAPLDAVKAGDTKGVGVIVGATAEEFNATVLRSPKPIDDERVERRLGRMGFTAAQSAAYRSTFAAGTEPWRVLGQAVTDSTFRVPAARFAEARARVPSTWAYEFQWGSPALGGMGAVHCLDVPFAFDVLDADGAAAVTGDAAPQELADAIHGAWVRFIHDGDPGWPRYTAETRQVMAFDATSKVVDDPWQPLRTIWPR
jgi:para-nitrobenzyl esterase